MPRRKVREYQSKKLFSENFKRFSSAPVHISCVQVTPTVALDSLVAGNPWLASEKLVVKPDMLFGKRGKNNLVLLNATLNEAKQFIEQRMGKQVQIGGLSGVVDHFVVEPFLPHSEEYYLSIMATREKNVVSFSDCGGMEIEENWDKVKKVELLVGDAIDSADLSSLFHDGLSAPKKESLAEFIRTAYKVFEDLNYHFMEMNPFTITASGQPFPLDMRGEIDDCANFKNHNKWKVDGHDIDFPTAFGKTYLEQEKAVRHLDEQTGASLKLTVLNPHGRIWGMIAGGGASVIYADTVADLGLGNELGNYGEYSGDPSEEDTYQYACQLLSLVTHSSDGADGSQRKALLIGGAIANFTDIAATFSGIIRALRQYAEPLSRSNIKIFVRRGGPNYRVGLQKMRELEGELHIPFEVFGPEVNMTNIVKLAINWVYPADGTASPAKHGGAANVSAQRTAIHA